MGESVDDNRDLGKPWSAEFRDLYRRMDIVVPITTFIIAPITTLIVAPITTAIVVPIRGLSSCRYEAYRRTNVMTIARQSGD